MGKSSKEINKIATLLLEQSDLKEEMDSLGGFIYKIENEKTYYFNGEVVSNAERIRRTERKVEILQFILEKAKKTTLIEGEITLTEPEEM